jgi:hypothetical protein
METETWRHGDGDMETWTWRHSDMKRKTGNPGDFSNPFNIFSSGKRKIVICPFVDEETNGSYPFANGLNKLAHIC